VLKIGTSENLQWRICCGELKMLMKYASTKSTLLPLMQSSRQYINLKIWDKTDRAA